MERRIKIDNILDKYIIVVEGDEKKVVYDVDDSRIFSVHITGCGRGARNASLNKSTFKTISKAKKDIKYLDSCYWSYKFKIIKVSDLKTISEKGWNFLMKDIENYNRHIDFEKECAKEEMKAQKEARKKLEDKAIELMSKRSRYSIEEGEDTLTITLLK